MPTSSKYLTVVQMYLSCAPCAVECLIKCGKKPAPGQTICPRVQVGMEHRCPDGFAMPTCRYLIRMIDEECAESQRQSRLNRNLETSSTGQEALMPRGTANWVFDGNDFGMEMVLRGSVKRLETLVFCSSAERRTGSCLLELEVVSIQGIPLLPCSQSELQQVLN